MKRPYTRPALAELAPGDPRALALAATLAPMSIPPNSAQAAAAELARSLRELANKPATKIVLRGLEAALPEASALVRGALADPAATLGEMARPMAEAAVAELLDADRVIASGLARAFGRGVRRGSKRGG